MIYVKRLIFIIFITVSCQSLGKLKFIADIPNHLNEVSAVEVTNLSNLFWAIEDAGNANKIYGLNSKGQIIKEITITNASNIDWEDLTSDNYGNLYIGDFGNNNEKRQYFRILKLKHEDLTKSAAEAEIIEFTLPDDQDSKDFESFFLFNSNFYIFSKETKKFRVLKIPNEIGKHVATLNSNFNLNGKNNKITSADISDDGKIIVLLNHEKLWKITNFNNDAFFTGDIIEIKFDHDSQKEGICFISPSEVIITDERNGATGGNVYSISIK